MNKYLIYIFIISLPVTTVSAQNVSAQLKDMPNQEIHLKGFNGFSTYDITSTTSDEKGNFRLGYSKKDHGMGYLTAADGEKFLLILSSEDIELEGETLTPTQNRKITKGNDNQYFEQYEKDYATREQALSAWEYLEKIYQNDVLFSKNKKLLKSIQKEKSRINKEDAAFLTNLPKDSYAKWFLSTRKLLGTINSVAKQHPEEISATYEALQKLNYADERLYKSGLYRDAIESHIHFIENSSGELGQVFGNLNQNIDTMLSQLKTDKKKFNEVTGYLFATLENQNLLKSSQYLAVKTLNEYKTVLENNLAAQFEISLKIKNGNTAPDIFFGKHTYFPENKKTNSLIDIKANYIVLVFAAGWCPHCTEEIPKLAEQYKIWEKKGVEIVLVSLDEKPIDFAQFAANLPFISTCDYAKLQSKAVKDYAITGTPAIYILDKDKKIILRPNNTDHAIAWLDATLDAESKK